MKVFWSYRPSRPLSLNKPSSTSRAFRQRFLLRYDICDLLISPINKPKSRATSSIKGYLIPLRSLCKKTKYMKIGLLENFMFLRIYQVVTRSNFYFMSKLELFIHCSLHFLSLDVHFI